MASARYLCTQSTPGSLPVSVRMAEVSRTTASVTGALRGRVSEQFVQQPLSGAGAAHTIHRLAPAGFG